MTKGNFKIAFITIILAVILIFGGCSSSENKEETVGNETFKFDENKALSAEEFSTIYDASTPFKGSSVDLYGQVFYLEKTTEGVALQVNVNMGNRQDHIIAYHFDPNSDIKENEFVHIQGVIGDVYEGENAMGGTLSYPTISTYKVEKSSYAEVFSPAVKSIEVNQKQSQHGLNVEIKKIELAENETRVYFKISNESNTNMSFYSFNTKLIQGTTQFDEERNYEAGYPEVQSDLSSGVETEGIVTFKSIGKDEGFKITCEGNSDDYSKDFELFTFDIGK
jgi:hypothetical protein